VDGGCLAGGQAGDDEHRDRGCHLPAGPAPALLHADGAGDVPLDQGHLAGVREPPADLGGGVQDLDGAAFAAAVASFPGHVPAGLLPVQGVQPGPQGRGVAAELGRQREVLAVVHTCGKALASAGAFVCCGETLKTFLVNRARTFIFSTAMPPYLAGQIRAALHLAIEADDRRAHLRKIASTLREKLSAAGLSCGASATQIVPVILGANEAALRVAAELQANGFAVKAIRPPTVPAGTARVRLSLTSSITLENIHCLAAVMAAACKSLPQTPSTSPVHA